MHEAYVPRGPPATWPHSASSPLASRSHPGRFSGPLAAPRRSDDQVRGTVLGDLFRRGGEVASWECVAVPCCSSEVPRGQHVYTAQDSPVTIKFLLAFEFRFYCPRTRRLPERGPLTPVSTPLKAHTLKQTRTLAGTGVAAWGQPCHP